MRQRHLDCASACFSRRVKYVTVESQLIVTIGGVEEAFWNHGWGERHTVEDDILATGFV
jgi:hypothetical protein